MVYKKYVYVAQKTVLNIGRAKIIETFWPVASAERRTVGQIDRQTDRLTVCLDCPPRLKFLASRLWGTV